MNSSDDNFFDSVLIKTKELYDSGRYQPALSLATLRLAEAVDSESRGQLEMWCGLCSSNLQDFQSAIQSLIRAKQLLSQIPDSEPLLLDILKRLGEIQLIHRNDENALECFQEAEKYLDHFELPKWKEEYYQFRFRKGQALSRLGRFRESIHEFQEALRVANVTQMSSDDVALARFMIGKEHYLLGDFADAAEYLTTIEPEHIDESYHDEYYLTMAGFYSGTRELKKAEHCYKELEKIDVPPELAPNAFYVAGTIYTQLGNSELAKKFFRKALDHPAVNPKLAERILGHLDDL